jgi:hypothetical protein
LKAFEEGDLMRGGGRNLPLVGVVTLSLIIDVDVKASRYCSKNFFFFASKVVQRWRLIMLLLQSRIVSNEKLFKFDVLKKKNILIDNKKLLVFFFEDLGKSLLCFFRLSFLLNLENVKSFSKKLVLAFTSAELCSGCFSYQVHSTL